MGVPTIKLAGESSLALRGHTCEQHSGALSERETLADLLHQGGKFFLSPNKALLINNMACISLLQSILQPDQTSIHQCLELRYSVFVIEIKQLFLSSIVLLHPIPLGFQRLCEVKLLKRHSKISS
jgi:hypothetical protein